MAMVRITMTGTSYSLPTFTHQPLRIFIMEGVITCGVALFAFAFIVKFPDQEKSKPSWGFLNKPGDIDMVIDKLNADRGDVAPEPFSWKKFLAPATQWYIYGFAFIFFCVTTIAYGFAFFLPIILSTKLKFSVAMAQCMGAPPYAASGFMMYGAAAFSDKASHHLDHPERTPTNQPR